MSQTSISEDGLLWERILRPGNANCAGCGIPYATTLSIAHRDDFICNVRKARRIKGFPFLLMLSPSPTGWEFHQEPDESADSIGHAVRSGLFSLYEIFDGVRYRINERPDGTPVEDFVSRQRRYKTEAADAELLRTQIHSQWQHLEALEKAFPARTSD